MKISRQTQMVIHIPTRRPSSAHARSHAQQPVQHTSSSPIGVIIIIITPIAQQSCHASARTHTLRRQHIHTITLQHRFHKRRTDRQPRRLNSRAVAHSSTGPSGSRSGRAPAFRSSGRTSRISAVTRRKTAMLQAPLRQLDITHTLTHPHTCTSKRTHALTAELQKTIVVVISVRERNCIIRALAVRFAHIRSAHTHPAAQQHAHTCHSTQHARSNTPARSREAVSHRRLGHGSLQSLIRVCKFLNAAVRALAHTLSTNTSNAITQSHTHAIS